jgi:hypothetical protein
VPPGGRIGPRALVPLVALVLITLIAFPVAASARTGPGPAVISKKKRCKPTHHAGTAVAAKKRCKRRKVAKPSGDLPQLRASVSWSGTAVVDLHAWADGKHTGWSDFIGFWDLEIPRSILDPEKNLQRLGEWPNPNFSRWTFGVCYYNYAGTNSGPTDLTVHLVYADGSVSNFVLPGVEPGESFVDPRMEGGPPSTLDEWCPPAV